MSIIVLGTGHQKSVRDVLRIAEGELRRVEGIPRKITLNSDTVKAVAERKEFDGDYDSFTISMPSSPKLRKSIDELIKQYSDVCMLEEEEGAYRLLCPPLNTTEKPDKKRVLEVVDKICGCTTLPEVWRVTGGNYKSEHVSIELLFQAMIQYKASDVHLSPGDSPIFRIDNDTHHSDLMGILSASQILALLKELTPEIYWKQFEEDKQTSFNYHQYGLGYARVSAFLKSGAPHLTMRFLPEIIPSFEELHIPSDTMAELANLHRGLLLVTGMTGSGKTTTVAALVDWINEHKPLHILTIENPIEYVHRNKKSVISQRSLGPDVNSFGEAVSGALRHDPDVIVIGEMRDADTIRSAINAAATGHLVISTLHSNSACEVVNRIISFFDPIERDLVKLQLRDCLQCIICQRLAPQKGGGRIPCLEIMFNDVKPINDSIIEGDTDGMRIGMQQTVGHSFLFEVYLLKLVKKGIISVETAQEYATEQTMFDQMHMGTYSVPRVESLKAARDAQAAGRTATGH